MIGNGNVVEITDGERISDYALFKGVLSDVAESKKAAGTMRVCKEFAESLIASMKDGFSVLDNRGVHVAVNEALCHMTGFSREELIGTGLPHPYWLEEECENIEKAFQKMLSGEFSDFELIFRRKNGERFPVIVSPSWIKDDEGKVLFYFATVKDITELKKAEEALRESEEKRRLLVDNARDVVWSFDLAKGYTFMSPACERIIGYPPENYLEDPEFGISITCPEDLPKLNKLFADLRAGKEPPQTFELCQYHRDGHVVHQEFTFTTTRDEAGNIVSLDGVSRDITERKKAEEEIRKLTYAVEQAIDGVAICDLELTLTYVNKAFARMHGYSPEEMIGMKVGNLHSEEQRDECLKGINEVEAEGSWIGETRHLKKDGTSFPLYLSVTLLTGADGKPRGILTVARVVTQILNEVIWHAAKCMNGETSYEEAMNEIVRTINPIWSGESLK